MNKNVKYGLIISYLILFLNMVYGLVMTPYILKYVGDSSYGVYKSVASLSSTFAVMDLGLGATMTRYMAKFSVRGEHEKAENFFAMTLVQFSIIAAAIIVVSIVLENSMESIYGNSFNNTEIILAKQLILLLFLSMIMRLFENLMTGVINGHEKFLFSNSLQLISVVLKFILLFALLPISRNVILIVLLDCALIVFEIILSASYIVKKIRIIPRLKHWDVKLFKESFGYTILMFIQTITIQFNGNVDNVFIGSLMGSSFVTIYSMALVIFGMYENLSGSIANIMLPNMMKRVESHEGMDLIQSGVEKAGRIQFVLLAAALSGFIILGQDFFKLWLGEQFHDCYYLTLILIIPVTFPMIQNVALSVLRAQNKMVFRTVTLLISCAVNIAVTVIGIRVFGYWGAALGTAISKILNLIMMNVYYHIKLEFKVIRMFINITRGILECALVAGVAALGLRSLLPSGWLSFILNAGLFMMIYVIGLLVYGLKNEEKKIIFGSLLRRK